MPTLDSAGLITLDRKVELLPYKRRPFVEREVMSDQDILNNAGSKLFLNVESYPNYFCITFKLHGKNSFFTVECGQGRSFNPKFLSWVMHNYKTVGFNSLKYDLIVLWLAYH